MLQSNPLHLQTTRRQRFHRQIHRHYRRRLHRRLHPHLAQMLRKG